MQECAAKPGSLTSQRRDAGLSAVRVSQVPACIRFARFSAKRKTSCRMRYSAALIVRRVDLGGLRILRGGCSRTRRNRCSASNFSGPVLQPLRSIRGGQGEIEERTLRNDGFVPTRAVHQFHEPLHDGQSQSATGIGLVQLMKRAEEPRDLFGSNTGSMIAHEKSDLGTMRLPAKLHARGATRVLQRGAD